MDRVLQLLIQNLSMCYDYNRVKDLLVFVIEEACCLVDQPTDRVALSASCRVLDEVVGPRSLLPCVRDELSYTIELMISGKDHGFFGDPLPSNPFLFDLEVDEAG